MAKKITVEEYRKQQEKAVTQSPANNTTGSKKITVEEYRKQTGQTTPKTPVLQNVTSGDYLLPYELNKLKKETSTLKETNFQKPENLGTYVNDAKIQENLIKINTLKDKINNVYSDKEAAYKRGLELALAKRALSDTEKEEAKTISNILKGSWTDNMKDFFNKKEYSDNNLALANTLDNMTKTGNAIAAGFFGAVPGVKKLAETGTEKMSELFPKSDVAAINQLKLAQTNNPAAYGAGSVASDITQLLGLSAAANAATKGIKATSAIGKAAKGALTSGATFGTKELLSSGLNGEDKEQAAKNTLKSTLGGAAGGAAGSLIGSGLEAVLTKTQLMTPLSEAIKQTLEGTGFASANLGVNQALTPKDERMSEEEMIKSIVISFAYSALTSYAKTLNATSSAKRELMNKVASQEEKWSNIIKGTGVTPQSAQDIMNENAALRKTLRTTYLSGQQNNVNDMVKALDNIDEMLSKYIGPNAQAANFTGNNITAPILGGNNIIPPSQNGYDGGNAFGVGGEASALEVYTASSDLQGNESDSLINKLKNSISEISKEAPVSQLTGEEFPKGAKKITEQVGDFFKSIGNKVFRNNFGEVILDERGIKDSISHGLGRGKAVTFAAVPDVIKSGKQIDYQKNWKERGYNTYAFAAPIKIGDETNYVAVIVREMQENNKYYLHEVVDSNGNVYYKKSNTLNSFKTGAVENGYSGEPNALPNNNIPQTGQKNNGNSNSTPKKAEDFKTRAENKFLNDLKSDLGFSKYSETETLKKELQKLFDNPDMEQKDINKLFSDITLKALITENEFYNNYKGLKENIRNTTLKIDDQIKRNITDFSDFRKANFNTLRLSEKEGLPIDSFYSELQSEYPGMLPEVNTQEEMLQELSSLSKSIQVTEKTFTEAFKDKAEYAKLARKSFNNRILELKEKYRLVKNYAESKDSDPYFINNDIINEAYKEKAVAQRALEKEERKNLLTERDRIYLDMLVKGNASFEELPKTLNIGGIRNLYKYKKEIYEANQIINEIKYESRKAYAEEAESLAPIFDSIKDKKAGFLYSTEIAERNIRDILPKGDYDTIVNTYFDPVDESEARATEFREEFRDKVRDLNLSNSKRYTIKFIDGKRLATEKASESTLVQLLGEKKITPEQLKATGANVEKIEAAVKTMRQIYNDLISRANKVYVENGYEPIEYRKDYFPHFTESKPDGVIAKMGAALGINIDKDELPTDIAGLTQTFRPGRKWFSAALRRNTETTSYDALKGFDRYIEGVSDVIYHTKNIQKLRALESAIRYRYSDEGIKAEVDKIKADNNIAPIDKQNRIEDIYREQTISKAPNFVTWLRRYTDTLAGKKSDADRSWEKDLGRQIYSTAKELENRVSANMVVLNPGSWLTNFIPITQVAGIVDTTSLLNALKDTAKAAVATDDFVKQSDFLISRFGSKPLTSTPTQKAANVLGVGWGIVDDFTSEVVVRAKYYDNVKKGMNEKDAMADSNKWAARAMAARSKGAMPTAFNSKNPISKLFTMFQLEINNQYRYYFKDIPREAENLAGNVLLKLTGAFLKMFLGTFLYNEISEKIVGRRPAFDPTDIAFQAVLDYTGYERNNIIDVIAKGDPFIEKSKNPKNIASSTTTLAKNIAEEVPFVGGLMGGGRVPISSAIPNIGNLNKGLGGLLDESMNKEKALSLIGQEVAKPAAYLLPPVAGGQIKKAVEGYQAVKEGGSYSLDSDGKLKLRYPVESDSLGTYAKAMIFGPYSLPRAQEYVDSGFKTMSAKQTENYHKAVKSGITYDQFKGYIEEFSDKKISQKRNILFEDKSLTPEQKDLLDKLLISEVSKVSYKDAESFTITQMSDTAQSKWQDVKKLGYTAKQYEIYYGIISASDKKKEEKISELVRRGLKVNEANKLWDTIKK
jgi:hypothetical protein